MFWEENRLLGPPAVHSVHLLSQRSLASALHNLPSSRCHISITGKGLAEVHHSAGLVDWKVRVGFSNHYTTVLLFSLFSFGPFADIFSFSALINFFYAWNFHPSLTARLVCFSLLRLSPPACSPLRFPSFRKEKTERKVALICDMDCPFFQRLYQSITHVSAGFLCADILRTSGVMAVLATRPVPCVCVCVLFWSFNCLLCHNIFLWCHESWLTIAWPIIAAEELLGRCF